MYVTFRAGSDYVKQCFSEYGLTTDASGEFSAMYKPFHLIGLDLRISVASVALRLEPTGVASDAAQLRRAMEAHFRNASAGAL